MTDCQSIAKLNKLHPKLRDMAICAYNEAIAETPENVTPYIVDTYRSFEESYAIYRQGRSLPGTKVSNAPGGHCWHNYGLAINFNIAVEGEGAFSFAYHWMKVIAIFEAYGFNSGIYSKSKIKSHDHLENAMGQTIEKLLLLHLNNILIPGTPYVDF